jgi:hypothetical protein
MLERYQLFILWFFGLVGMFSTVACSSQASSSEFGSDSEAEDQETATAPTAISELHNIASLQARFNQDDGVIRLVLLLSPT